ncbi:polyprenol monophosphomannose synthase [Dactylosporangium sp. NPDC051485]|uniref:polyprenol monophosphomannose synthase n=1 Tax=Dactylosporangium sp. NPDC051485 TaxID=3154846 RepID=UPI003428FCCE
MEPEPQVCVVIPTRNEADNVAPMLRRLDAALAGMPFEVMFVDDSDDDTPETIRAAGASAPDRIRLLHRLPGQRPGGLGGAVVAGIAAARTPWVVVMDGDLQHPPETVPALIEAATEAGADVVVASRYRGPGRSDGLGGLLRRLVSRASGTLARLAFPLRLRPVTDPMSGFFAVRREAVEPSDLRPNGYKILLEILVRGRIDRVVEVPYTFQARHAGASKASLREGLRFGYHLARLRSQMLLRPRLRPARAAGSAAGASAVRRMVIDGRRSVRIRFALACVLTVAAFPAVTPMFWNGLWSREPDVPLVIPLAVAAALLVGRLKAPDAELDVHDRQVDGLLATFLLMMAAVLTVIAPDDASSSAFALLATAAYLAGATVLLLGTRAAARLRWALVLPLVALDVPMPAVQHAGDRLIRGGAALISAPFAGRLDATSLFVRHAGQTLVLPESAVPATALPGAVLCLALAGLCCFGATRRLLARVLVASGVVTAVAVLGLAGTLLAGRLLGPGAFRVAVVPGVLDVVLAVTIAIFVWRWSRAVAPPPPTERRYVPRGRRAALALVVMAAALGGPALPVAWSSSAIGSFISSH